MSAKFPRGEQTHSQPSVYDVYNKYPCYPVLQDVERVDGVLTFRKPRARIIFCDKFTSHIMHFVIL